MKITFFTIAPSPHIAGLLKAVQAIDGIVLDVRSLVRSLPKRAWDSEAVGVEWRPISTAFWREGTVGNVAVVSLSYFQPEAHRLVRRCRAAGVPVVAFSELPSPLSPWVVRVVRRRLARRYFRGFSGLVGVTELSVTGYRTQFGVTCPAEWCPYHRDLIPLLRLAPRKNAPERVRFAFVGSLVRRKAPDVAVRAFSRVNGPAELVMLGSGPMLEQSRELSARLAPERVVLQGFVPYAEVPRHLSAAHALLMPSRFDGFGMAVMESLAAGLPVIASDRVMAALQYVHNGENGFVVPVDDVGAFATAMQYYVDRRADWPAFSAAARASLAAYDVRADAERLVAFLAGVVERHRAAKPAHGRVA